MKNNFNQEFFLKKYKYFIFDFDGIIKESVNSKNRAYCKLFEEYKFASRSIEKHHMQNGGVSRYEKIPLYLDYCKLKKTPSKINFYLKKFSQLSTKMVIESDWTPGIKTFLNKIQNKNSIFIVSATPEKEIKNICSKIDLNIPKINIYGSPNSKEKNIKKFFKTEFKSDYIFFGDSIQDSLAASIFEIDFAFRSYYFNSFIIPKYYNFIFESFLDQKN